MCKGLHAIARPRARTYGYPGQPSQLRVMIHKVWMSAPPLGAESSASCYSSLLHFSETTLGESL